MHSDHIHDDIVNRAKTHTRAWLLDALKNAREMEDKEEVFILNKAIKIQDEVLREQKAEEARPTTK